MTTNHERIKNMTVNEMANYLTNFVCNTIARTANRQNIQINCDVMQLYKTYLEYLESESEE